MNAAQALYSWLSTIADGVPAYASASVPSDASFPYLTYDLTIPSWGDGWQTFQVKAWSYGDSEAEANEIIWQIAQAVPTGGVLLRIDGGQLWITRGSPFAQAVEATDDDKVKLRYINLDIENQSDF